MNTKDLEEQLRTLPAQLLRHKKLLFVIPVVAAYIFVAWRVNVLGNAQPTQKAVASHQTTQSLPQISPSTLNKIQQLQSNSVSVQALFNQARQDPFNE